MNVKLSDGTLFPQQRRYSASRSRSLSFMQSSCSPPIYLHERDSNLSPFPARPCCSDSKSPHLVSLPRNYSDCSFFHSVKSGSYRNCFRYISLEEYTSISSDHYHREPPCRAYTPSFSVPVFPPLDPGECGKRLSGGRRAGVKIGLTIKKVSVWKKGSGVGYKKNVVRQKIRHHQRRRGLAYRRKEPMECITSTPNFDVREMISSGISAILCSPREIGKDLSSLGDIFCLWEKVLSHPVTQTIQRGLARALELTYAVTLPEMLADDGGMMLVESLAQNYCEISSFALYSMIARLSPFASNEEAYNADDVISPLSSLHSDDDSDRPFTLPQIAHSRAPFSGRLRIIGVGGYDKDTSEEEKIGFQRFSANIPANLVQTTPDSVRNLSENPALDFDVFETKGGTLRNNDIENVGQKNAYTENEDGKNAKYLLGEYAEKVRIDGDPFAGERKWFVLHTAANEVCHNPTPNSTPLQNLPHETLETIFSFLSGPDLGRCCCLNRFWRKFCATNLQPVWHALVLKTFGFKYENYMIYCGETDWQAMYMRATVFVGNLLRGEPKVSFFPQLLKPVCKGYRGSLALTADTSILVWENGEFLQAVNLEEGEAIFCVRVEGVRDIRSKPCLVNARERIFFHMNKKILVFCLFSGKFIQTLKTPPSRRSYEPSEYSLDISIRNGHLTYLTNRALFVFDTGKLQVLYQIQHTDITPEKGMAACDIDFLWAGYQEETAHTYSKAVCGIRKSRHIVTWLRRNSRNIKVFDVLTGSMLHSLRGHKFNILRIRQTPNPVCIFDYYLASLDLGGDVLIWDCAEGGFSCIQRLCPTEHLGRVLGSPVMGEVSGNEAMSSSSSCRGGSERLSCFSPELEDISAEDNEVWEDTNVLSYDRDHATRERGILQEDSREDTPIAQGSFPLGSQEGTPLNKTFRLSFSSTHLMTMTETEGTSFRVRSDHPGHNRREYFAGSVEDQVPCEVTTAQRGVILNLWKFDSKANLRRGARSGFNTRSRPVDRPSFALKVRKAVEVFPENSEREIEEPVILEKGKSEIIIGGSNNLEGRLKREMKTVKKKTGKMTSVRKKTGKTTSVKIKGEFSYPLEQYATFAVPDNAYFADFLDNDLIGLWLSKSSRESPAASMSDWRVFNCLNESARASAAKNTCRASNGGVSSKIAGESSKRAGGSLKSEDVSTHEYDISERGYSCFTVDRNANPQLVPHNIPSSVSNRNNPVSDSSSITLLPGSRTAHRNHDAGRNNWNHTNDLHGRDLSKHTNSSQQVNKKLMLALKDSYVFSMIGRGDVWTLLDWKCLSLSNAGDLQIFDFCPANQTTNTLYKEPK